MPQLEEGEEGTQKSGANRIFFQQKRGAKIKFFVKEDGAFLLGCLQARKKKIERST